MKIVLVCVGGITTNVLAKKMKKYGEQKGYEDEIRAFSYRSCEQSFPEADLILVAPQAQVFAKGIRKMAEEEQIPCHELEEADIILGDPGRIYRIIDLYRKSGEREKKPRKPLTLNGLVQILGQYILTLSPFLLGIAGIRLLSLMMDNRLLDGLYASTGGIAGIYAVFAFGYCFAKQMEKSPVIYGILCLICCFMLLPMGGAGAENMILFGIRDFGIGNGYIRIETLGFLSCLYLLPISCAASSLYYYLDGKLIFEFPYSANMLEEVLKSGVTILGFFFLRVFLEIVLGG